MKAYERLLEYVKIHTMSDETTGTSPSTMRQFDLGNILVKEMKELGIEDARIDDKCYVYGTIPATLGYEDKKSIGFIAHMDTAPSASGEGVNPKLIKNYDGSDIVLEKNDKVISVEKFTHLKNFVGRTIITTDGSTLLGADDKAGIAEILTACEEIIKEDIPHGKICIAFTPDEEIGHGADHFDVKNFGADFAYTMDGGIEGELAYENFNAAMAKVEIEGVLVHPGSAKNKMINALNVGCEFNSMLPFAEKPEYTEGYEGFFYLEKMHGDTAKTEIEYIIRDHDAEKFQVKKDLLLQIEKFLNEKYGEGTVKVTIKDQYKNMVELIKPCFHLIDNAKKAMETVGVEPVIEPIRGGTDGATLSYMGLPCPNIGTGGFAFHGECEHITVEGMDVSTAVIKEIVKIYAAE